MLSSIPIALSVLAAFTTAAPVAELIPRSCSLVYPSTLVRLDQKVPNDALGQTDSVKIYQEAGGNGAEEMEVQFTGIPSNAWGCQLEVFFPAGYPVTNYGSRVNVWNLDRDINRWDTWNNAPAKSYLFGTSDITSDPYQERKIVINSLVCKPTLNFRFDIASDDKYGYIAFKQQNPNAIPAGFRLTHNC